MSRDAARARIAVALDVAGADEARTLAGKLRERVGWLKVGLQLYTAAGPSLVRELIDGGHRVFLDLKLHDIPNTVGAAAAGAARLGAGLITVHAAGGTAMMRAAAEAAERAARADGATRPRILAVTALTSLDETDLAEIGLLGPAGEVVERLAGLALRAGCDGVVCSPAEIPLVRGRCGGEFLIVTPGIRPAPSGDAPEAADDQKRVATPAAALSAGADLIVIGRPITAAADPAGAADRIVERLGENLGATPGRPAP